MAQGQDRKEFEEDFGGSNVGFGGSESGFVSRSLEAMGIKHDSGATKWISESHYNYPSWGQVTGRKYLSAERHIRQRIALASIAGLGYAAYHAVEATGLI